MHPTRLGLIEAADLIRRGELSSAAYARALLERVEARADLAAFISLPAADDLLERAGRADAAAVRARARGERLPPLHGVPLAVKDNIDTADLPTTAGTPALRAHRPTADADVVRALRAAGALVLGKTNLHELAYGVTSDNGAFGAVRNPYDGGRTAGGSSGGTAAAVAAGLAPAGLGTDTGGSVRIPAALCGVVGLRPTAGRYPQRGLLLISGTRDTAGPMARTVADVAALDAALTGGRPGAVDARAANARTTGARATDEDAEDAGGGLRGVRLGVVREPFFADLPPDVAAVLERCLARLQDGGARVVETELPPGTDELIARTMFSIPFHETPATLRSYLAAVPSGPTPAEVAERCGSPDVRRLLTGMLAAGAARAADYAEAMAVHRPALAAAYDEVFAAHRLDALVAPTTPLTAVRVGAHEVRLGGRRESALSAYTRTTGPGSVIGLPGLTVPAGLDASGLPVGLALDGVPGRDRELLRIGHMCELLIGRVPAPPW
ncbi:amidase family protein [Streptomyces sp. URMC 123]|uniref:amidase family protein n=1 Tax=Streptomyces sp. URMC 123 TaxID=3423403 RepID=UPI003F194C0F